MLDQHEAIAEAGQLGGYSTVISPPLSHLPGQQPGRRGSEEAESSVSIMEQANAIMGIVNNMVKLHEDRKKKKLEKKTKQGLFHFVMEH
mmetsp:Transcript_722/g.897  ORF Transcript_722/g.897 Transcript_722/m.897 type:complete len:89 (+) Transcript_722:2988-3254(+)